MRGPCKLCAHWAITGQNENKENIRGCTFNPPFPVALPEMSHLQRTVIVTPHFVLANTKPDFECGRFEPAPQEELDRRNVPGNVHKTPELKLVK